MDSVWMEHALMLGRRAFTEDQLPVGAVIVMDGKIIGNGVRLHDTDTRLDHAEIQALRNAMKTLGAYYKNASKACIYTTLEPCIMCMGTILNCRIGKVIYALEDPYGGAVNIIHTPKEFLPPRHQVELPIVEKGVCREESRMIFEEYFRKTKNEFWKDNSKNPLYTLCMGESA